MSEISKLNGYDLKDKTIRDHVQELSDANFYNDAINVKSLGAVGDGETDDTEILQDAIDNYNIIYLPEGNYLVSSLILSSNTKIYGDGYHNSIITFTANDNGLNIFDDTHSISNVQIDNLSFRSSVAENIIYLNNAYGIVFNNCEIYDTSNNKSCNGLVISGFDLVEGTDTPGYYITYNSGRISNCDNGVKLLNQANSNLIFNVEIYLCNTSIYIDNSNGNKISFNTLQDFLYNGVEINNTSNLSYSNSNIVIGNYIEGRNNTNTVESGIKIDNSSVRTTQLISNKFSNLYSNSAHELIDYGTDTLRLDYTAVSPSLEPITLPAFVRVNVKPNSYASAYKNEKLFGCVQMFADDEGTGKLMVLNRIYNSETEQYGYYWSEILAFNNSNKFDMTDKTIEGGTLLSNNILQYYGKYVKVGTGDLPNVEGAIMYDSTLKKLKFSDGSTTKYVQTNAVGSTASRTAHQGYGFMMFDTTIGKPIWYDGTKWVDATGTQV